MINPNAKMFIVYISPDDHKSMPKFKYSVIKKAALYYKFNEKQK